MNDTCNFTHDGRFGYTNVLTLHTEGSVRSYLLHIRLATHRAPYVFVCLHIFFLPLVHRVQSSSHIPIRPLSSSS